MGLLDLYAAQADTAAPKPVQALPRSLGERIEATAAETFAPDRYFNITGARREQWQRAVDELHGATGEAFANPYGAVTAEEMTRLGNQSAIIEERRTRIIDASRMARAQGNDSLFDPENIDRYIGEEANRRRQRAASFEGTGHGIGNFVAGTLMAAVEPINVLTLGVPVSRLPMAASSIIGETFLRNVAREAALQAGVNVAAQGATELFDYASRRETGTEQTTGELVTNIAAAGLFGGFLGGGVRALHLKWLGLPERVRAAAPLEVKDAFRAIEADALYSGQNRIGVDPLLHERYQGRALDAVMRGAPVSFDDLARTVDTPLTALGTILRQPEGVDIRNLPAVMAALEGLPDSEIAAFAREVRPNSFARLDKVEAELAEARGRLAEIDTRQPSIADLLDADTAMRLQDIETDLAAPALSRKQRTGLERERDMILQTVDPKDRLPKQAEKAQRAERAKVEAEIAKLEPRRAEALETANKATADLRRKLGRYADIVDPPDVVADFGLQLPDLADAIGRADLMRQARMLREIMPEGIAPQRMPAGISEAPKVAEEITPDAARALDTETARLLERHAAMEVEIDGRAMTAGKAMEEADRLDREAQVALGCAVGAL